MFKGVVLYFYRDYALIKSRGYNRTCVVDMREVQVVNPMRPIEIRTKIGESIYPDSSSLFFNSDILFFQKINAPHCSHKNIGQDIVKMYKELFDTTLFTDDEISHFLKKRIHDMQTRVEMLSFLENIAREDVKDSGVFKETDLKGREDLFLYCTEKYIEILKIREQIPEMPEML
jgi:hypothetical protein